MQLIIQASVHKRDANKLEVGDSSNTILRLINLQP